MTRMLLALLALGCSVEPPLPIDPDTMSSEASLYALGPVTVSWDQPETRTGWVEYEAGDTWKATPRQLFQAGRVETTVVGVPLGFLADWRVVLEDDRERTYPFDSRDSIINSPLPKDFPPPTITVSDQLGRDDYVFSSVNERACGWCGGPYWSFIADREGRIVWASRSGPGEWTLFTQLSVNRDHVILDIVGNPSAAIRTYLDAPIETIEMPGHHHGFIELPDGTLAWGQHLGSDFFESILEKAPGSDEIRTVWSCNSWREVQGCRSNALEYDPVRDVYWFSFYSNSSVAEINRTTGELVGFSDLQGSPPLEYTFDPPDSAFTWQHGPRVLPNGNLLISNDDRARSTTKVSEYTLDRETRVFTEVWSYDPQVLAEFNGDVLRLDNGNTMHSLGAAGTIYEVDDAGTKMWEIAFGRGHQVARLDVIEDLYTLVAP